MIDSLLTHVTTQCTSFNTVTYTETSEPIDDLSDDAPVLYVSLGDEEAEENELLNGVNQKVNVQVNFIIVALTSSIESLKTELKTAVLNHSETGFTPFTYVSSSKLDTRAGYEWREVVYQTAEYYRSV